MSFSQFTVSIGLQPALEGVRSELWAMFVDPATGEDVAFNTGIGVPLSVGGSIDFAASVGVPTSYRFFLFIPEQTVGGVSILQAQTAPWLGSMQVVSQVINVEVVGGEPPPVTSFTLSISSVDGGVTNPVPGNYIFEMDTVVSVMAVPAAGFAFAGWIVNGAANGDNPVSVVMSSNVELVPSFTDLPGNGNGEPPGNGNGNGVAPSNLGLIVVAAAALALISQR